MGSACSTGSVHNVYDPNTGRGGTCSICYDENVLVGYPRCCQLKTQSFKICPHCLLRLGSYTDNDVSFTCPTCRSKTVEKITPVPNEYSSHALVSTLPRKKKKWWERRNRIQTRTKFVLWPHFYVSSSYNWTCVICLKIISDTEYTLGNMSHSTIISACESCLNLNHELKMSKLKIEEEEEELRSMRFAEEYEELRSLMLDD